MLLNAENNHLFPILLLRMFFVLFMKNPSLLKFKQGRAREITGLWNKRVWEWRGCQWQFDRKLIFHLMKSKRGRKSEQQWHQKNEIDLAPSLRSLMTKFLKYFQKFSHFKISLLKYGWNGNSYDFSLPRAINLASFPL